MSSSLLLSSLSYLFLHRIIRNKIQATSFLPNSHFFIFIERQKLQSSRPGLRFLTRRFPNSEFSVRISSDNSRLITFLSKNQLKFINSNYFDIYIFFFCLQGYYIFGKIEVFIKMCNLVLSKAL